MTFITLYGHEHPRDVITLLERSLHLPHSNHTLHARTERLVAYLTQRGEGVSVYLSENRIKFVCEDYLSYLGRRVNQPTRIYMKEEHMQGLPTHPDDIYRYARGRNLTTSQANQLLLNLVRWVFRPKYTQDVARARAAIVAGQNRGMN